MRIERRYSARAQAHSKTWRNKQGLRKARQRLGVRLCSGALGRTHGSVLLEVILAVVLFAGAAVVVGIGLKAAMDGAERLRMNTHAGNLAVTVISELQMGIRSPADTGPEAFGPPFEGWVWEIAAMPWTTKAEETEGNLTHVEVIVRHEPTEFVHRFAQVVQIDASTAADGSIELPATPAFGAP